MGRGGRQRHFPEFGNVANFSPLAPHQARALPHEGGLGTLVVHKVVRAWPINVDSERWNPDRVLGRCHSGLQLVPLCHGLPGMGNHVLPVLHLTRATLPGQVNLQGDKPDRSPNCSPAKPGLGLPCPL